MGIVIIWRTTPRYNIIFWKGSICNIKCLLTASKTNVIVVLVPKTVSELDISELVSENAGEGGSDDSTRNAPLRDPSWEQIYVVYVSAITGNHHSVYVRTTRISIKYMHIYRYLLPTRIEERGLLGVGSIQAVILPSCQYMRNIASYFFNMILIGQ